MREGLTYKGKLYGPPFYGESAMTYYRTDLFEKAGLKMPDVANLLRQIPSFADKITDRTSQTYGICLRGKPGWGENMAFITPSRHCVRRTVVRYELEADCWIRR